MGRLPPTSALITLCLACTCLAAAQNQAGTSDSSPTATLKVDVRLVPVRAVVRDAEGHPVGNLTREDFQIFDNDRPQAISHFSVERNDAHISRTNVSEVTPEKASRRAPTHYTVYLFDDLHLERTDLIVAREAADRHLATLSPSTERVAVLTTSGQKGVDFTADTAKLRQAVLRLEPAGRRAADCQTMSYFMADLIANKEDADALNVATREMVQCMGGGKKISQPARQMAEAAAQEQVAIGRVQTTASLRVLKDLLQGLSKATGERTIVLVSPGFFTEQDPAQAEAIDSAVRENITIDALDPRGLLPPNDVTQRGFDASKAMYKSLGDIQESAVLEELTDATGGTFFHNNNDLDVGFRRLAATPECSYLLAFSPPVVKADGRFHKLKVTLKSPNGLSVQARKGYYLPKPSK
jgi:VWFA-related protein